MKKEIRIMISMVLLISQQLVGQPNCYSPNHSCYGSNPNNPYVIAIPNGDIMFDLSTSYKLVFKDEFNGTILEQTFWEPTTGVPRDLNYNGSKQYYIPSNINLSQGIATINILNNQSISALNTTFDYSSGEFQSRSAFGYGLYSIRCKLPKGVGFYPSFWLFGANGVPEWNEIDVFEFWNKKSLDPLTLTSYVDHDKLSKNQVMTSHYSWNGGNKIQCGDSYENQFGSGNYNSWVDYSSDFHTFFLEWHPAYIAWFVDDLSINGLKRVNWKWTDPTYFCGYDGILTGHSYLLSKAHPQNPMNIITSMAVQNNNGNEPDNSTPFPSFFEIDEISYYKQIPCPTSYYIPSGTGTIINNLSFHDAFIRFGEYNLLMGSTILVDGDFIIKGWVNNLYHEQWETQAIEEITLTGDFVAEDGSDYVAKIISDPCSSNRLSSENINLINNTSVFPIGKFLMNISQDSVSQLDWNEDFIIYPNPIINDSKLTITPINNMQYQDTDINLVIYSVSGNEIFNQRATLKEILNSGILINFGAGFYIIKIESSNGLFYQSNLVVVN